MGLAGTNLEKPMVGILTSTAAHSLGTILGTCPAMTRVFPQNGMVTWYRHLAEYGYADAQNHLGDMYCSGEGVAQNDAEAVKWVSTRRGGRATLPLSPILETCTAMAGEFPMMTPRR